LTALSPDQLKIIQPLINTATQASAALRVPIGRVETFLTSIAKFVWGNYKQLNDYSYLLLLTDSRPKKPYLDHKTILRNIRNGKRVFYVDEELRLISASDGEVRMTDCVSLTDKESALGVLVTGTYAWEILRGKVTNECDVIRRRVGTPVLSKFHRPMSEFEQILSEHMENSVARQQHIRYWKDRSKRILLAGPDGTEGIFHLDLYWWLNNYVADKLKVYAEPKGLGQDKTDIIVVTLDGSYVIEVKWLGTNENKQKYDQTRINEGLAQVKIYLDNDSELVCGYLVVYDGRPLTDNQTQSGWNDALRHALCQAPKILFLDNETPSVAATRIAKGKT
jgi:hypothetical protein